MIAPDIVERAQRGDRHAFAMLVEQCYPRALRFARRMLGQLEDAEEAVQDCFVRVHASLPRFKEGSPFEPWFFRILANRCRTHGANRQRRHAVIRYEDVLPEVAFTGGAEDSSEWRAEVLLALAALPDEQREAFLLRHVEEMSYEDMATITGVRAPTLRMRVFRACDALRLRLKEVEIHG